MSSLVSCQHRNCKLGHDCRRVCSHRRRDETRQFRLVGVGGVYWALRNKAAALNANANISNDIRETYHCYRDYSALRCRLVVIDGDD